MCPLLVSYFLAVIFPGADFMTFESFRPDSFVANDYLQTVYPRIYEKTIRTRRDIYSNLYTHELSKLKMIEVGNWTLELNPESNLVVAPTLEAEWVSGNGDVTLKAIHRCDYKLGVVSSLEMTSRVAVTLCGRYVTGYISVGNFVFFIEPVNRGNSSDGEHQLYRQEALFINQFLAKIQ